MTRKDYKLIAQAIIDAQDSVERDAQAPEVWSAVVRSLATALKQENPKFDTSKFYTYLGF